jgi:hypothetical protein
MEGILFFDKGNINSEEKNYFGEMEMPAFNKSGFRLASNEENERLFQKIKENIELASPINRENPFLLRFLINCYGRFHSHQESWVLHTPSRYIFSIHQPEIEEEKINFGKSLLITTGMGKRNGTSQGNLTLIKEFPEIHEGIVGLYEEGNREDRIKRLIDQKALPERTYLNYIK